MFAELAALYVLSFLLFVLLCYILNKKSKLSIGYISFTNLRDIYWNHALVKLDIACARLIFKWPSFKENQPFLKIQLQKVLILLPKLPASSKTNENAPEIPKPPGKSSLPGARLRLLRKRREGILNFLFSIASRVVSNIAIEAGPITLVLGDQAIVFTLKEFKLKLVLFKTSNKRPSLVTEVLVKDFCGCVSDHLLDHLFNLDELSLSLLTMFKVDFSNLERLEPDVRLGAIKINLRQLDILKRKIESIGYATSDVLEPLISPKTNEQPSLPTLNSMDYDSDPNISDFYNEPLSESENEVTQSEAKKSPSISRSSTLEPTEKPLTIGKDESLEETKDPTKSPMQKSSTIEHGEFFKIIKILRRCRFRIRRLDASWGLIFKYDEKALVAFTSIASAEINDFVVVSKTFVAHKGSGGLELRIGKSSLFVQDDSLNSPSKIFELCKISISVKINEGGPWIGGVKYTVFVENPCLEVNRSTFKAIIGLEKPKSDDEGPVLSEKLKTTTVLQTDDTKKEHIWPKVEGLFRLNRPRVYLLNNSGNELHGELEEIKLILNTRYSNPTESPASYKFIACLNLSYFRIMVAETRIIGFKEIELLQELSINPVEIYESTMEVQAKISETEIKLNDETSRFLALLAPEFPQSYSKDYKPSGINIKKEEGPISDFIQWFMKRVSIRLHSSDLSLLVYGQGDLNDVSKRGVRLQCPEINAGRLAETQEVSDTSSLEEYMPGVAYCKVEMIKVDCIQLLSSPEMAIEDVGNVITLQKAAAHLSLYTLTDLNINIGVQNVNIGISIYALYSIAVMLKCISSHLASIEKDTVEPGKLENGNISDSKVLTSVTLTSITLEMKLSPTVTSWIEFKGTHLLLGEERIKLETDFAALYGTSPKAAHRVKLAVLSRTTVEKSEEDKFINISIKNASLQQPDGYNLSDIFDHLNNNGKAAKWIFSRVFEHRDPAYSDTLILLPRIKLGVNELIFELEDTPFEVSLNRNYRMGLMEQKERLARAEALELKLQGVQRNTTVAWNALRNYDSQNWIRKVKRAKHDQREFSALLAVKLKNTVASIVPPSYGLKGAPGVIRKIDGVTPLDFAFDLLVPLFIDLTAEELCIRFRDYPDPLILFPEASGESGPCVAIKGDLIIQEQYPQPFAFRHIDVNVCEGVTAKLSRTISPVKIYTNAAIRASSDTILCWNNALVPVLQEIGHAFNRFYVASPDPSPPLGFWDKLALHLHGRIKIEWPKTGEFRVRVKSGLNPYAEGLEANELELLCRGVSLQLLENSLELKTRELVFGIPGDAERGVDFEKVIFRSTGGIQIGVKVGLERSDKLKPIPHYQVVTKVTNDEQHDSFRLYRTDVINAKISVKFMGGFASRNSAHLTTRLVTSITKFVMGMTPPPPIRTGTMYPQLEPAGPSLTKHLREIGFTLSLSPFAVTMVHRELSLGAGVGIMVGFKAMVQSIDAKIVTIQRKKQSRYTGEQLPEMEYVINEAICDVIELDARVIGTNDGTTLATGMTAEIESIASLESRQEWLNDDDDYTELGMEYLASEDVFIEQFLCAPRFTYFVQSSLTNGTSKPLSSTSDKELQVKDIRSVQLDLFTLRKKELDDDILELGESISVFETTVRPPLTTEEELELLRAKQQLEQLILSSMSMAEHIQSLFTTTFDSSPNHGKEDDTRREVVVHNANIIWSKNVRNVIYRFVSFTERYRAMTFYQSAMAIKTLRKIEKGKDSTLNPKNVREAKEMKEKAAAESEEDIEKVILDALISSVSVPDDSVPQETKDSIVATIMTNVTVQLLNTQIRFQTSLDAASMIYLVAEKIEYQSLVELDPAYERDVNNEVIKTKMVLKISDLQLFIAFKNILEESYYGAGVNAENGGAKMEVWVPLELLIDDNQQGGFQRLIPRTSASLTYEKNNPLRLATKVSKDIREGVVDQEAHEAESRAEKLFVHVKKFAMQVNAEQFQEIQAIIIDLLIYQEPLLGNVDEIKSVMLSAASGNFGDISTTVAGLQEKIRILKAVESSYEAQRATLSDQQLADYQACAQQVKDLEGYLYVVMEGIKRHLQSQKEMQKRITMLAEHLIWTMINVAGEPICEATLNEANITWILNEDGSSINSFEIDRLFILNRLPFTQMPEMLAPLSGSSSKRKMIRVYWKELAPVAGIKVVEHFEINLIPLSLALTNKIGKQIINYFFPTSKTTTAAAAAGVGTSSSTGGELKKASTITETHAPPLGLEAGIPFIKKKQSIQEDLNLLANDGASTMPSSRTFSSFPTTTTTLIGGGGGATITSGASATSGGGGGKSNSITTGNTTMLNATTTTTSTGGITITSSVCKMQNRASRNRTFIYIKLPSVSLKLSYKGAKEKNLEDLHGFVFVLPTFEYKNKTWTSLEMIEQLKKDMVGVVLSHTGALLKEKLFAPKPKLKVEESVVEDSENPETLRKSKLSDLDKCRLIFGEAYKPLLLSDATA